MYIFKYVLSVLSVPMLEKTKKKLSTLINELNRMSYTLLVCNFTIILIVLRCIICVFCYYYKYKHTYIICNS